MGPALRQRLTGLALGSLGRVPRGGQPSGGEVIL